jgi:hypothetical protein
MDHLGKGKALETPRERLVEPEALRVQGVKAQARGNDRDSGQKQPHAFHFESRHFTLCPDFLHARANPASPRT